MKTLHEKRIVKQKFLKKYGDQLRELWIEACEFSIEVGGRFRFTNFGAVVKVDRVTYPFYLNPSRKLEEL